MVIFSFISTCILLGLFSPGSAETYIGRGEKLNRHLMASCVRNIYSKNYENLIIFVHARIKNVWDVFLRRSVM